MVGFFILSISFLVNATMLEPPFISFSIWNGSIVQFVFPLLRLFGYGAITISLILDPIAKRPDEPSTQAVPATVAAPLAAHPGLAWITPFAQCIGAFAVGLLYLQRATKGLERHLKPVAAGFLLLALAELIGIGALYRDTTNVRLYSFVAAFGPLWIVQHIVLLTAVLVMQRWVFGYLFKRFETQIIMILTSGIVLIFLLAAVTMTTMLLRTMEDETLRQLTTDVKVLSYAMEGKKAQLLSDVQVIAQNPNLPAYMASQSREELKNFVAGYYFAKQESHLVVIDSSGRVLTRGEDPERYGDSFSGDPLVGRALAGEEAVTVTVKDAVISRELFIRAAAPIRSGGSVVGVVLAATVIDNAFVDGVKKVTGLDSSIYAGDSIAATTLTSSDGKTRPLGASIGQKEIVTSVLSLGKNYSGELRFAGQPFIGAFEPLPDIDNSVVGMLFIGQPRAAALATAGTSFELTFLVLIVLMLVSILPAFAIGRYITTQIR